MTNAHNNNTKNGSTNGTRRGKRRGFTLIEILIVVVILGVLAALVIPGVTSALGDANIKAANARASQITTMYTRYVNFKEAGDPDIVVAGSGATAPAAFGAFVTKGYCSSDDLVNQIDSAGWYWNDTSKKFESEPPTTGTGG
jgi:prepilin-type N-terminal cleavage/methylation domain-containing protein